MLSLGVSLDAMAVSFSLGNIFKNRILLKSVIVSISFGLFQMVMPIIGYYFGGLFNNYFYLANDIIAFIILGLLGLIMIMESFKKEDLYLYKVTLFTILLLSISTSLDAFIIGITLSFSINNIIFCGALFFAVTFVTSFVGCKIGSIIGNKYGFKSKLIGGIILLMIAIKSLIG